MSGNPSEMLAALLKGPGAQEKLLASLSAKGAGGVDDDANKQQRKESFLQSAENNLPKGYLSAVKTKPVGKYELKSTAIIPVALVDGINSDLPGTIKAIVTETVWDHLGTCPLIPQGTTAEGIYDSQIAHGQRRILAAWNKLIFRDGSTFMLEGMSSGDQAGYAGFDGDVDNHYFKVFGGAVLMSIIGAGAQYAEGPQQSGTQPSIKSTISSGLGQQIAGVSGALVQKNLSIQPTIIQKPGYKFIIKVRNDMVFPSKCGA
jgi:type IV secretion system protein VirB10